MLLWILAVSGSALVLTQSSLTAPLRERLSRYAQERPSDSRTWPPCPGCSAHRAWRVKAAIAKLISCPMCSGFWLGAFWAMMLMIDNTWRALPWPAFHGIARLAAAGFAGSIASALAVAAWLALSYAATALSLMGSGPKMRVPPKMRPAYTNTLIDTFVCACGEAVPPGGTHALTDRCGDKPTELVKKGE
jgi:hypothetical protein